MPSMCHDICQCVSAQLLQSSNELIEAGTQCEHVHLMASGFIIYEQDLMSSTVREMTGVFVGEDKWLCEAALWTHWVHVGRAEARPEVHLVTLIPGSVVKCLAKDNRFTREASCAYAAQFQMRIREARPSNSSKWPTDVEVWRG